jgi:hypothetical protein
MFGQNVMMAPGRENRDFTVSRPSVRSTENAREGLPDEYIAIGTIRGVMAQANSQEISKWQQLNHPITHKIIMSGKPAIDIRPDDVFEYGNRRFFNRAIPYDVGDLGHYLIFYCNERADIT